VFQNITLPGGSKDETDLFHFDPLNFIRVRWEVFGQSSYIIAFERVFKQLEAFLRAHGYEPVERFFNTRFPVSDRQDPWIVVMKKKP
jgi:hypothetical protein